MLQAVLQELEIWAAPPRVPSSAQVGRDHWICTGRWVKPNSVWYVNTKSTAPAGRGSGFPGSSSPSCSLSVFYCSSQVVFRSFPHFVHSLLSSRHNSFFFVLHQCEGYRWRTVETAGELFPAWCSCEHVWGTLCWSQMDPLEETKGLTHSLWLFWWGLGQDL